MGQRADWHNDSGDRAKVPLTNEMRHTKRFHTETIYQRTTTQKDLERRRKNPATGTALPWTKGQMGTGGQQHQRPTSAEPQQTADSESRTGGRARPRPLAYLRHPLPCVVLRASEDERHAIGSAFRHGGAEANAWPRTRMRHCCDARQRLETRSRVKRVTTM